MQVDGECQESSNTAKHPQLQFRIKVNHIISKVYQLKAMASTSSQAYLKADLQLPEDETLRFREIHTAEGEIKKPPGVQNLEEWGQIRAPSGKHPGKSFKEIYGQDPNHVSQLKNRRGVSAWLRNFQMYSRARLEITNKMLQQERQMPVIPKKTTDRASSTKVTEDDWIPIQPTPPAKGMISRVGEHKRGLETEKTEMQIEQDPHKIMALQTQIAVLQKRELAKETEKVGSSNQSKGAAEMA